MTPGARLRLVLLGLCLHVLGVGEAISDPHRVLSMAERVAAQEVIERVHDSHRERAFASGSTFPERIPRVVIEEKVADALRRSVALERLFQRPVTTAMLQAEIDRMVRDTKQPGRLRELFAALGDDPVLIGECLARQALTQRLLETSYAAAERSAGAAPGGLQGPEPLRDFSDWWRDVAPRFEAALPETTEALVLRDVPMPACEKGWLRAATLNDVLDPRAWHSALWTGKEMIVWGGLPGSAGRRYDPLSDAWLSMPTGGAIGTPRLRHVAVWTGREMIVWGGYWDRGPLATGARYDPEANLWLPMSTPKNLAPRYGATAVWTGSEMIVWGGEGGIIDGGGRYDPSQDSWRLLSSVDAPIGTKEHTAVWTGNEMVVWGGIGGTSPTGTGGLYDPLTDTWRPTAQSRMAIPRYAHTAVWTGTEMVIWGGYDGFEHLNGGARYDPDADSWRPMSPGPGRRAAHRAVWTGSRMIVFGGYPSGSAAIYEPASDTWTSAGWHPTLIEHTAVWSGTEMIVWGGYDYQDLLNTGARFDPVRGTWTPTSTGPNAPSPREGQTAVWTGSELIVWGGEYSLPMGGYWNRRSGGAYVPATDSWSATSTGPGCPTARQGHSAVWTGTEMIVWGGYGQEAQQSGGRYDPVTDRWVPTSTASGCPPPRGDHVAIWTGSSMIVWGGDVTPPRSNDPPRRVNSGGRYDPVGDAWLPTATGGACPSAREGHTAAWTGTEMVVWGGLDPDGRFVGTGGRYRPSTDSWAPVASGSASPVGRADHTAVWTGSQMIVWGGRRGTLDLDTGGRYDPLADSWSATSVAGAPQHRSAHTAVWTGYEMLVWGGTLTPSTGGRYLPRSDSWTAMEIDDHAPGPRRGHSATWTDAGMIVWAGYPMTSTGGIFGPGLRVLPRSMPAGVVGSAYAETLVAEGGTPPHEFVLDGGVLPPGLTLALSGQLSGVPASAGLFDFSVAARDAQGCNGSRSYRLEIVSSAP